MLVHIETASPDGDVWRAVTPVTPIDGTGSQLAGHEPADVAEMFAVHYADEQESEGAGTGARIRAVVTDNRGDVLAVSGVHIVDALAVYRQATEERRAVLDDIRNRRVEALAYLNEVRKISYRKLAALTGLSSARIQQIVEEGRDTSAR